MQTNATNRLMVARGDEGGTLTGSWRRWSLGKPYEEWPGLDFRSGPWRERDKEREILGFVWRHFTFRVKRVSEKMDSRPPRWNYTPQLWSRIPNCSTDHKCHIFLYSSGLLSLCLCVCVCWVSLMKNISKAVLCKERFHRSVTLFLQKMQQSCTLCNLKR